MENVKDSFKVIAVAGLSGSGKSTLVKKLAADKNIPGDHQFADLYRDPGKNLPKALEFIGKGESIIVADIAFCGVEGRNKMYSDLQINSNDVEWHYIEKDIVQCLLNCVQRRHFHAPEEYTNGLRNFDDEIGYVIRFSKSFHPPVPAHVHEVSKKGDEIRTI